MHRPGITTVTLATATLTILMGCGGGRGAGVDPGSSGAPSPSPLPTQATSQDLQFCVDALNQYRAQVQKPPLARSTALEGYAAQAARVDGTAHVPHQYFSSNNGGGVSASENEVPWWSLTQFHTVQNTIANGLGLFWVEAPSGPHYQAMAGPFTQVGCGVFINGAEITVVVDFR